MIVRLMDKVGWLRAPLVGLLVITLSPAFGAAGQASQQEPLPASWYGSGQDVHILRRLEGRPAPPLQVKEWNGESRSLHEMAGKIIVIDFWAHWCPYCFPCLRNDARIAQRYADQGVEVIAIHDGLSGQDGEWLESAREHGVTFPHALDSDDPEHNTMRSYGITSFPSYAIIDRQGRVRAIGLRPDRITAALDWILDRDTESVAPPEFPPEFYLGRENRPSSLRRLEGKPAPPLRADLWLNNERLIHGNASIELLQFFSVGNRRSLEALDGLAEIQADLLSLGVHIVAVAPPDADWQEVQTLAESRGWTFSIMRDQYLPDQENPPLARGRRGAIRTGQTADDYSIGPLLPSVLIDGDGLIRAAGFRWNQAEPIARHAAEYSYHTPFASKSTGDAR